MYLLSLDSLVYTHNGRHQEEDAGHEGREGQCHGQVRSCFLNEI